MTTRSVLDSSVLIDHWHRSRRKNFERCTPDDARGWARELIAFRMTDAIVSPVQIEMLCGVRNQHELRLTRAYLGEFRVLDEGRITVQDWQEAVRLAARVPRDGKPRQLGDCLVKAIALRLRREVITYDRGF